MTFWRRIELLMFGFAVSISLPEAYARVDHVENALASRDGIERDLQERVARDEAAVEHVDEFRTQMEQVQRAIGGLGDLWTSDGGELVRHVTDCSRGAKVGFSPRATTPALVTISGSDGRLGALRSLDALARCDGALVLLRVGIGPHEWSADLRTWMPRLVHSGDPDLLQDVSDDSPFCFRGCRRQIVHIRELQQRVRRLESILGGDADHLDDLRAMLDDERDDRNRLVNAIGRVDYFFGGDSPIFYQGLIALGPFGDGLEFIGRFDPDIPATTPSARDPFRAPLP